MPDGCGPPASRLMLAGSSALASPGNAHPTTTSMTIARTPICVGTMQSCSATMTPSTHMSSRTSRRTRLRAPPESRPLQGQLLNDAEARQSLSRSARSLAEDRGRDVENLHFPRARCRTGRRGGDAVSRPGPRRPRRRVPETRRPTIRIVNRTPPTVVERRDASRAPKNASQITPPEAMGDATATAPAVARAVGRGHYSPLSFSAPSSTTSPALRRTSPPVS